MSDFLHTPNCDIVHQEKVKILNENGVFHNDDNFTLLYVDIGPKSETIIFRHIVIYFMHIASINVQYEFYLRYIIFFNIFNKSIAYF